MNHAPEQPISSSPNAWLGPTEYIAIGGSFVAAIVGIASQQLVALAALPLSASLAVSLANRNRQFNQMSQVHLNQIAQMVQDRQADQKVVADLAEQSKSLAMHIVDLTQKTEHNKDLSKGNAQLLKNHTYAIDSHAQTLEEIAKKITHIQKATAKPDEFYYEDGLANQKAGDLEAAVSSFNLALKANETMAEAFYQRGLVEAELGRRQSAIADLRIAASLFFDQGKLELYQKAKDLSKNVHEAMANTDRETKHPNSNSNSSPKALDAINIDHLFN